MITLYANPYDREAAGFYFETAEVYASKAAALRNSFGDRVEEFEIDLINGDGIDIELAKAWGLNQCNFSAYLDSCGNWDVADKRCFIIAVGECGYDFNSENVNPADYEVDIYDCNSMRDLAIQFVEEGLFGDIPEHLANYIDYDAIANDLSMDYSEIIIDGQSLIYRCV